MEQNQNQDRKWLPHIGELIDRLAIHQLKEVFISEHKEKYASEMKDIVHDIEVLLKDQKIDDIGKFIHAIIIIAQINLHIWMNESKARKGESQDASLLVLTHSLNGIRNSTMNAILSIVGNEERKDMKIDCLAGENQKIWDLSFFK